MDELRKARKKQREKRKQRKERTMEGKKMNKRPFSASLPHYSHKRRTTLSEPQDDVRVCNAVLKQLPLQWKAGERDTKGDISS